MTSQSPLKFQADPDQNSIELNVNNYGNEWTATEHMKTASSLAERPRRVQVDPDKMIAGARRARRPGNCTSVPSPESSLQRSRTIRAHSSEPCHRWSSRAFHDCVEHGWCGATPPPGPHARNNNENHDEEEPGSEPVGILLKER